MKVYAIWRECISRNTICPIESFYASSWWRLSMNKLKEALIIGETKRLEEGKLCRTEFEGYESYHCYSYSSVNDGSCGFVLDESINTEQFRNFVRNMLDGNNRLEDIAHDPTKYAGQRVYPKLEKIQIKINKVTANMEKNITKAVERGGMLNNLDNKSAQLFEHSNIFKRKAEDINKRCPCLNFWPFR